MVDRRRIARRLGGPAARRRGHKRVSMVLAVLLVASVGLTLAGTGPSDDDAADDAREAAEAAAATADDPTTAACRASNVEIATAQRALLNDNQNPGAIEGFLGDAFVDLARRRAQAIVDSAPPEGVADLLADQAAVVDAIAADPASASGQVNPFDAVNQRWRDLGLPDCAIDSTTVRVDG